MTDNEFRRPQPTGFGPQETEDAYTERMKNRLEKNYSVKNELIDQINVSPPSSC